MTVTGADAALAVLAGGERLRGHDLARDKRTREGDGEGPFVVDLRGGLVLLVGTLAGLILEARSRDADTYAGDTGSDEDLALHDAGAVVDAAAKSRHGQRRCRRADRGWRARGVPDADTVPRFERMVFTEVHGEGTGRRVDFPEVAAIHELR